MPNFISICSKIAAATFFAMGLSGPALQAQGVEQDAELRAQASYADLAGLADSASLVIRAQVKRQAEVPTERAPGLRPGFARLYVEAETLSLLAGSAAVGESLRYLVDVPRDERGRPAKLKKREFILFARSVPGRPGELQLADSQAQIDWSFETESRLLSILSDLHSGESLPQVTGVRDALSVAGNLAGESETQVFLETAGNQPLALSIIRRPGMVPIWGYSRSELVDQSARPARPETIDWYRLACFLPRSLPSEANLAIDAGSQQRAIADYAFVIEQLGACVRNRD